MAAVYSYLRFSSVEQAKGDSARRQLAMGESWLARHPEHHLDPLSLRDLGVSAFRGANLDKSKGELGKFIHLARQGKIPRGSILMLERIDRFSRAKTLEAAGIFAELVATGVKVLVLSPEQLIDAENVHNMEVVLPLIIGLQLAHEESKKKSERGKATWENKLAHATEKPLTKIVPAWLRLVDGKWKTNPERVKIVKQICKWCVEGLGTKQIRHNLNAAGVPTWGKSKSWGTAYVNKILRTRATMGEFVRYDRHNNKPTCDGIPNYYPAILTKTEWYKVQKSLDSRRPQRGPRGVRVANLFTGLIKNVQDESSMVLTKKGSRQYLVSSAAARGKKGSKYACILYDRLETAILSHLREIKPEELLPTADNATQKTELSELEGELAAVEHRIVQANKNRLKGDFAALLELLRDLEADRTRLIRAIESLRGAMATPQDKQVAECHDLLDALASTPEAELPAMRSHLRQLIANLVGAIWVRVLDTEKWRIGFAEIHYRGGAVRQVVCLYRWKESVHFSIATYPRPNERAFLDIRRNGKQLANEILGLMYSNLLHSQALLGIA